MGVERRTGPWLTSVVQARMVWLFDVIAIDLDPDGELLSLIYMSEEVGSIDDKNHFIPFIHLDSRTNRITEHLKTLGVRIA